MTAADFLAKTTALRATGSSIERAIAAGREADRLGYAFLGGYSAALTVLDPGLGPDELGALCATEAGGAHPRAIETRLENGCVTGTKLFVTGGRLATVLLVVAKEGQGEDGRPLLRVARVSSAAPGVAVEDLPSLDFAPEVPHGRVTFAAAPVERILEGDGYADALKPFRTIEDLHVFASASSYLLRVAARAGWSEATRERLLAGLATARGLARMDPKEPQTHLALAGWMGGVRDLVAALDWRGAPDEEAARWTRDVPLLRVAEKAREARRRKAWETLATGR